MRTLSTLCLPPPLSVKLDLFLYHCCSSLPFLHPLFYFSITFLTKHLISFCLLCLYFSLPSPPSLPICSQPPHDSLPPSTLSVSLPPPLRLSLHHCLVYPNVCLLLFTVITLSLFRPLQHQHPSVTTGITYRQ